MPIVETLISSVVFCVVGFGAGYIVSRRKSAKAAISSNYAGKADAAMGVFDENATMMSAHDLRVQMMEAALDASERGESVSDMSKRNLKIAAKTATSIVKQANSLIEDALKCEQTCIHMFENSVSESNYTIERVFNLDKYIWGRGSEDDKMQIHRTALSMVRHTYESFGYEVRMATDIDWMGNILINVTIDWSNNEINKSTLAQIEDISQIEAYRAGVPLADILA